MLLIFIFPNVLESTLFYIFSKNWSAVRNFSKSPIFKLLFLLLGDNVKIFRVLLSKKSIQYFFSFFAVNLSWSVFKKAFSRLFFFRFSKTLCSILRFSIAVFFEVFWNVILFLLKAVSENVNQFAFLSKYNGFLMKTIKVRSKQSTKTIRNSDWVEKVRIFCCWTIVQKMFCNGNLHFCQAKHYRVCVSTFTKRFSIASVVVVLELLLRRIAQVLYICRKLPFTIST